MKHWFQKYNDMTEQDFYFTVTQPSTAEFKDRAVNLLLMLFLLKTADDFKTTAGAEERTSQSRASLFCFTGSVPMAIISAAVMMVNLRLGRQTHPRADRQQAAYQYSRDRGALLGRYIAGCAGTDQCL